METGPVSAVTEIIDKRAATPRSEVEAREAPAVVLIVDLSLVKAAVRVLTGGLIPVASTKIEAMRTVEGEGAISITSTVAPHLLLRARSICTVGKAIATVRTTTMVGWTWVVLIFITSNMADVLSPRLGSRWLRRTQGMPTRTLPPHRLQIFHTITTVAPTRCTMAHHPRWMFQEVTLWMGGSASSSTDTPAVTAQDRSGVFRLALLVPPRLNTTGDITRKLLALEARRSILDSERAYDGPRIVTPARRLCDCSGRCVTLFEKMSLEARKKVSHSGTRDKDVWS